MSAIDTGETGMDGVSVPHPPFRLSPCHTRLCHVFTYKEVISSHTTDPISGRFDRNRGCACDPMPN
jgi:hypothetical protein